jgi:hypothetical protein
MSLLKFIGSFGKKDAIIRNSCVTFGFCALSFGAASPSGARASESDAEGAVSRKLRNKRGAISGSGLY